MRTIPVIGLAHSSDESECALLPRRPRISLSLLNLLENSEGSRRSTEIYSDISSQDKFHVKLALPDVTQSVINPPDEIDALYDKIKAKSLMKEPLYKFPIEGPRRIIVARHGERVDFTFGDWLHMSFDESGSYKRWDQNMPVKLPKRAGEPHSYYLDSPLTNMGLMQAKLIGDGLFQSDTSVHHVYCSPAYRCIQTCTNILKGLGIADRLPINVEPGLFEWLAWYSSELPLWMTDAEYMEAGFNINTTYEPVFKTENLKITQETCEQFYERNSFVTQTLLTRTKREGGTLLLVAHASSIDTCTRRLVGGAPRSANSMSMLIRKIPYCSVSCVVEDGNGTWLLREPPTTPVTHSSNSRYDWKILLHS